MKLTKFSPTRPLIFVVTGTPGTGKTTWSHVIGNAFSWDVKNDKVLARNHARVFAHDSIHHEDVVDITKWGPLLKNELKHAQHTIVLEGHLFCEMRLPADGVIVLTCPVKELEKRLRKRKYPELKIQDNLFCEDTQYVQGQVKKHYAGIPILVLDTHKPKKVLRERMLNWIQSILRGKYREIHSRTRTPTRGRSKRPRAHAGRD
jgi:adenylate kinase